MGIYKGVIFDFDGVIVNTINHHFLAWKKLANDLGFDIDLRQNEQLKGKSREDSLKTVLGWGNKNVSAAEFERLTALKNEDYLSRIASFSKDDLLPGLIRILDCLSKWDVPIAVGSSSRNAAFILKNLKMDQYFSAIVDGNDVTKAKPHPEVFLLAAEKMKLRPEDCIVFEDALAGIEAARNAGMLSIGIGDKRILDKADHNFSDFNEIEVDFLQDLFEGS